jgi:nitrate reductase beta subunit
MLDSVRLEILQILMQDRCMVCEECTIASEASWTHPMELEGDEGHVESHFGLFGDSVSVGAR